MYEKENELLDVGLNQICLKLKTMKDTMFGDKHSIQLFIDSSVCKLEIGKCVALITENEGTFVFDKNGSNNYPGEIRSFEEMPTLYKVEILSQWEQIQESFKKSQERQLKIVRDFKL